jgi:hypothetical protein
MIDASKHNKFSVNVTPAQFDELRTISVYLETPKTELGKFIVAEFINTMIADEEYQRFKGIDKSVGNWAAVSVRKLKEKSIGYSTSEIDQNRQIALKAFDLDDED